MPDVPQVRYTTLDRAIGVVSPRIARERVAHRYAMDMERYYLEAASKDRTQGDWRKIGGDEQVPANERQTARERARFQVQNNGYGQRAKDAIVDNVIGSGISTQCQVAFSTNIEVNRQRNLELEDLKRRWMEQADALSEQHWHEMQQMIQGEQVEAGELLAYKRYLVQDYRAGRRVLPLAYELIDTARLVSFGTSPQAGHDVIDGIERDANGRRVAYHVEEGGYRYRVRRIPAEFVYHWFRKDRPGQNRGITWLAPVLSDLVMIKDIKWYALVQRKVQSAIAAIITDDDKDGKGAPMPGLKSLSGETNTTEQNDPKRVIEPGMIHHAGSGRVQPFNPNPSNDLDQLTKFVLRGIGVSLGLSYEYLAGDYSDVTAASGRLAGQHAHKRADMLHARHVRTAEQPVHNDFIDDALRTGNVPRPKKNADMYAASFSKPEKEHGPNPYQEVNAAASRIKNCLTSVRGEIAARGGDPEKVYKEIERDLEQGGQVGEAIQQIILGATNGGTD